MCDVEYSSLSLNNYNLIDIKNVNYWLRYFGMSIWEKHLKSLAQWIIV